MTPAASNPWAALRDTLEKQTRQYERMLDLLSRKEKELIKGDTAKIARIVKEEEKFVNETEKLEQVRIKATQDCLPEHGEKATLRDVLDAAPANELPALESAAVRLMETLNKIAAKNRAVAELVNESIKFANYNINLLSSDRTSDNLYESSGKMKGAEQKKIKGIINREA